MNGQTWFVSGAGGFVGHAVCTMLASRGQRVLGLVRRKVPTLDRLGVETVLGDLKSPDPWAGSLGDARFAIHCAANAQFGNGSSFSAENVATTTNLLRAIRGNAPALERLVHVSTVGAVDRARGDRCQAPLDEASPLCPTSDYGRSKAAAEAAVRESGLPFVIVRPALVAGAGMRFNSHFAVFTRWALRGRLAARVAWTGQFSVVDVDDLCEALLLCATHPLAAGMTYFCGGEPIELGEHFAAARSAVRVPIRPFQPLLRGIAPALPFVLKSMVLPALVVDDGALRRLGWRPRKSAREALAPVVARERARCDATLEPPSGQTVVTGAASGLGRALARQLAHRRTRLLLVDRDGPGLVRLAQELPQARCLRTDLAEEAGWNALIESSEWKASPVVELYACAGFGRRGGFAADAIDAQMAMMRVNLLGRMRLAHAVLADMDRLQFGRVVLIASSSAFQPLPSMAAYAASNAALLAFGEGIAYESARRGIRVLTVCPGGMRTNFQSAAHVRQNPRERLMEPEEVAAAIIGALDGASVTLIVSLRARAMALAARLLPRSVTLRLWGRLMSTLR